MRYSALLLSFLACSAAATAQIVPPQPDKGVASGYVFEDKNKNGIRDKGEPGLAGMRVSNQRDIVRTDRNGKWQLPYNDETMFFVVKPRGWMTAKDEHQVPRFYYNHKPYGSPTLRFKGVAPTGVLPASIDFPLYRQNEPNKFSALFFGDTQPRDLREVDYIARDVVEPIIGREKGHSFGVVLGDVAFDNLDTTQPLVEIIGLIGIPWYYVLGNHDINYDAKDDSHSDEHWERLFGPNYYSFDYGPTHFVVLDNVAWTSAANSTNNRGGYHAELGKAQMDWLRKDLAMVPKHQMVVAMMHIPMTEIRDRQELYRILEERPYALSVSAHTHMQEHRFITEKDGWRKPEPHHHVINVTTCGSWWGGAPNGLGIPHTTMRDGAPNGYSVFTFDGSKYEIAFRAANRPANYQMNIIVPEALPLLEVGGRTIYANVFGGSEKSKVELSFGGSPWIPMNRVLEKDPFYQDLVARDAAQKAPFRTLPNAETSTHLWKGALPRVAKPGVYPLHVRTTDMHGNVYVNTRAVRVN